MAETATKSWSHWHTCNLSKLDSFIDPGSKPIAMLKERYKCPYFRILIIGRTNAGKTTILEKVCGVQQGTKPIIYNKAGELSWSPSCICVFTMLQVYNSINLTSIWWHQLRSVKLWNMIDIIMQSLSSEGHIWYWAPDYIPWMQLYLPWLSGFWIWGNWGVRACPEIHWEAIFSNWVEGSAACNLVYLYWFFKFAY